MARTISTFVSKDFINWEKGERIEYGNSNLYQLYTNNIAPYYRAPHYIFGFPTRYYARNERKRIHYELPSGRFKGVGSGNDITTASDGLFMASRDGIHFNRFDEFPIFPSGIKVKETGSTVTDMRRTVYTKRRPTVQTSRTIYLSCVLITVITGRCADMR